MPWKRSLLIRLTMTCIHLMMGGYAKGAYYVASSPKPQDANMWVKINEVRNYFTNPDLFDQAPRHTTTFARPHFPLPWKPPFTVGFLYIEATSEDYDEAKQAYIKSKLQGTQQLLSAHTKTKINNEDSILQDCIGLSYSISMLALLYNVPPAKIRAYNPFSSLLFAILASGAIYASINSVLREERASKWKEEERALEAKLSQEAINARHTYENTFILEKQESSARFCYKINIPFKQSLFFLPLPPMSRKKRDPRKAPEMDYMYDEYLAVDIRVHARLKEAEERFKKIEELENAVSL